MPRRTTLTFTSEDTTRVPGEKRLNVYYCKFSNKHVLTTDCNLAKAPRRRTDRSIVIDTEKYSVKSYATDGGTVLIKREGGQVERQYRYNIGKLPVMYKTEPEGRFVYVLDGALTAYNAEAGAGGRTQVPVPPCIVAVRRRVPPGGNSKADDEAAKIRRLVRGAAGGQLADEDDEDDEGPLVQVAIDCEDRASRVGILRITADNVRAQTTRNLSHADSNAELLEFLRSALGLRLSQVSIIKGETMRKKELLVKGLTPREVFEKLRAVATPGSGYGRRSRWLK